MKQISGFLLQLFYSLALCDIDLMEPLSQDPPPFMQVESFYPTTAYLDVNNARSQCNRPFYNGMPNLARDSNSTFPIITDPYVLTVYGDSPHFDVGIIAGNGSANSNVHVQDLFSVSISLNSAIPSSFCDSIGFACNTAWSTAGKQLSVQYWQGMAYVYVSSSEAMTVLFKQTISSLENVHPGLSKVYLKDGSSCYAKINNITGAALTTESITQSGDIISIPASSNLVLTCLPTPGVNEDIGVLLLDSPSSFFFSTSMNLSSETRYSFDFWGFNQDSTFLQFVYSHQKFANSVEEVSQVSTTGIPIISGSKGPMTLVAMTGVDQLAFEVEKVPDFGFTFDRNQSLPLDQNINNLLQADLTALLQAVADNYNWEKLLFGKALFNYAQVCILTDTYGFTSLKSSCVDNLLKFLTVFGENQFYSPFVSDPIYRGISVYPQLGNARKYDGENEQYNDHPHQYGYFIYAVATLHKLSPSSVSSSSAIFTAALSLIRDVANPSLQDQHFAFMKNFDFYSGHMWYTGLQGDPSGKKAEKFGTSINFLYACMLFGEEFQIPSLVSRSKLMLSITKQTFTSYVLGDGNKTKPASALYQLNREESVDNETFAGAALFQHFYPITPALAWVFDTDQGKANIKSTVKLTDSSERTEILKVDSTILGFDKYENMFYTAYSLVDAKKGYCSLYFSQNAYYGDDVSRSWALYFVMSRSPNYDCSSNDTTKVPSSNSTNSTGLQKLNGTVTNNTALRQNLTDTTNGTNSWLFKNFTLQSNSTNDTFSLFSDLTPSDLKHNTSNATNSTGNYTNADSHFSWTLKNSTNGTNYSSLKNTTNISKITNGSSIPGKSNGSMFTDLLQNITNSTNVPLNYTQNLTMTDNSKSNETNATNNGQTSTSTQKDNLTLHNNGTNSTNQTGYLQNFTSIDHLKTNGTNATNTTTNNDPSSKNGQQNMNPSPMPSPYNQMNPTPLSAPSISLPQSTPGYQVTSGVFANGNPFIFAQDKIEGQSDDHNSYFNMLSAYV